MVEKILIKTFKKHGLHLEVMSNLKAVKFLDIRFNSIDGT